MNLFFCTVFEISLQARPTFHHHVWRYKIPFRGRDHRQSRFARSASLLVHTQLPNDKTASVQVLILTCAMSLLLVHPARLFVKYCRIWERFCLPFYTLRYKARFFTAFVPSFKTNSPILRSSIVEIATV